MRLFAGTPYDQPPRCDRCRALETDCTCPPLPAAHIAPCEQMARVAVEKRRKGKVVTVIRGLPAENNDLPAHAALIELGYGVKG